MGQNKSGALDEATFHTLRICWQILSEPPFIRFPSATFTGLDEPDVERAHFVAEGSALGQLIVDHSEGTVHRVCTEGVGHVVDRHHARAARGQIRQSLDGVQSENLVHRAHGG